MNLQDVIQIIIPEGEVVQIYCNNQIIWEKPDSEANDN